MRSQNRASTRSRFKSTHPIDFDTLTVDLPYTQPCMISTTYSALQVMCSIWSVW